MPNFDDLSLAEPILRVLKDVGYETPSPIQAQTIPHILAGKDLLGQAQTGTGKTAAFALPLLSRLDLKRHEPQVLVLAPTRELAIQVSESFQRYAAYLPGFHVLPIYGGANMQTQIRHLKRGVHVIVATPGRMMDHMRRRTLDLKTIKTFVLDEGDEMLRMGFIDDVEWILGQAPKDRQILLFSATLPSVIRQIARKHLKQPEEITIAAPTATVTAIHQRFCVVPDHHKLDFLTRILETETSDATLIFVRTKTATLELSEKLEARGYASAALNGDIPQSKREQTIEHLKKGKFDIVVATDVAARGLDVGRISHVINYDMPNDTEVYVHRVGRTGRAGRKGEAILFVSPRERHVLRMIEKATRQRITPMELPSQENVQNKRMLQLKETITQSLSQKKDLSLHYELLQKYHEEYQIPLIEIAAALSKLVYETKFPPLKERDFSLEKSQKKFEPKREFKKWKPRRYGASSHRR